MNSTSISRSPTGDRGAVIDGTLPNGRRRASMPRVSSASVPCPLMSSVRRPRRQASTERWNQGVPGCSVHTHTLAAAARFRSAADASCNSKNSCGATTRFSEPSSVGSPSVTTWVTPMGWADASGPSAGVTAAVAVRASIHSRLR